MQIIPQATMLRVEAVPKRILQVQKSKPKVYSIKGYLGRIRNLWQNMDYLPAIINFIITTTSTY